MTAHFDVAIKKVDVHSRPLDRRIWRLDRLRKLWFIAIYSV